MLGEKQPVKHVRKTAIPTFFLFLVLISLSFVNMVTYECRASTDQIEPAAAGLGPFQGGEHISLNITLSANSIIIPPVGKIYGYIMTLPWRPNGAKWMLKNPSNEVVYQIDSEDFTCEKIIGSPGPPPGWPDWLPWPETGLYAVAISIPDIKVPAFSDQGSWKLELYIYDRFFIEHNMIFATWHFSVGESSMVDNLFAPIYLTWGGIAVVGWGAFSFALPGIFWLTSPFWILALLFIVLAFYARSIRLAVGLIKEGGNRFKKVLKGGGKT